MSRKSNFRMKVFSASLLANLSTFLDNKEKLLIGLTFVVVLIAVFSIITLIFLVYAINSALKSAIDECKI